MDWNCKPNRALLSLSCFWAVILPCWQKWNHNTRPKDQQGYDTFYKEREMTQVGSISSHGPLKTENFFCQWPLRDLWQENTRADGVWKWVWFIVTVVRMEKGTHRTHEILNFLHLNKKQAVLWNLGMVLSDSEQWKGFLLLKLQRSEFWKQFEWASIYTLPVQLKEAKPWWF